MSLETLFSYPDEKKQKRIRENLEAESPIFFPTSSVCKCLAISPGFIAINLKT